MITDYRTYKEAQNNFKWDEIWEFYDGNRENFNITHECIDRHPPGDTALRIKFFDGRLETFTFGRLSAETSKFAHALQELGVRKGQRVCMVLDPCFEYYVALFGAMKMGAVAVPCFTGFGKDGLEHRIKDSGSSVLVTTKEKADLVSKIPLDHVIIVGDQFNHLLEGKSESYPCKEVTLGNDVAVYQYTSGTTKKYPEIVKHYHKSMAIGLPAAVFCMGLRKGEHFFCPASPAWGHGLWYGTFAPLSMGISVGAYSGKFDVKVLLEALVELDITTIAAAPTVFRVIKNSELIKNYNLSVKKISYTGEPMDTDTHRFVRDSFGVPAHGGYGSTEVGPIVMDFCGFDDYQVIPGSLGLPMIGVDVAIIDDSGNRVKQGETGEIAVRRKNKWFRVKDLAVEDENGYYWHKGRADDVIISSGWTISPIEVEDKLRRHPNVLDAVVVGKPDKDRGSILVALLKVNIDHRDDLKDEISNFVKTELSRHEYPRKIEFVDEIPLTQAGKIDRKLAKILVLKEEK